MTDRALRTTFLGNDRWSVPCLEAVAASRHPVGLVLTRVARPGRRGSRPVPTPVAEAARRLGLPLAEVDTVRHGPGSEALSRSTPDVLVVVAYGEILPPEVLGAAVVGPVNVHFSLLPELRGASPVRTALLRGLDRTGVTTMLMDQGLDTGAILRQEAVPIEPTDDAGSLGRRLAEIGGRLLVATLDDLASGSAQPTAQDTSRATTAAKLGPEDRRMDWSMPAGSVVNAVRAFAPEPGALAAFRGRPLKVLRAEETSHAGTPGTVLVVDREGFVVAAGSGAVRILEVAPAGKRRMTAGDFVRGHRPTPGEPMA